MWAQIPRFVLLSHKSELLAAMARFTCLLLSWNFHGSGFNRNLWWGSKVLFPKWDPRVFFLFPVLLFCSLRGTHPVESLLGNVWVNLYSLQLEPLETRFCRRSAGSTLLRKSFGRKMSVLSVPYASQMCGIRISGAIQVNICWCSCLLFTNNFSWVLNRVRL